AQQTFAAGAAPFSVAIVDVDHDGRLDLVAADYTAASVQVLRNASPVGATTLSFDSPQAFAVGDHPAFVTATDLDGDGLPDLLAVNRNANTVSLLLNSTQPGPNPFGFVTQQTFATGSVPGSVSVADFNGDGRPDLLVGNSSSASVSVLLNTS